MRLQATPRCLITGESGAGKEVLAHLIHQRSHRSRRPMITINCAGVPESLLESELFGHTRGSFTDAHRDRRGLLEMADGGTVLLDEVGDMSMRMQTLLLRFLESGEIQRIGSDQYHTTVDVRVIAATNHDLYERTQQKLFREDLYYRLNVVHLVMPPLRARREDIKLLFEHFLRVMAERYKVAAVPGVARGAGDPRGVSVAGQRARAEERRRARRGAVRRQAADGGRTAAAHHQPARDRARTPPACTCRRRSISATTA